MPRRRKTSCILKSQWGRNADTEGWQFYFTRRDGLELWLSEVVTAADLVLSEAEWCRLCEAAGDRLAR